jgi:alpha-ketoglutaric semialdehyde dehydrogenase
MPLTGQSIIGSRRGNTTGKQLRAFNPATREELDPVYHSSSIAEVNEAADLAHNAFSTFGWLSGKKRAAFLRRIAEKIEALGEELVERAVAESALPLARIRGERGRTVGQLRFFADILDEGSWVDARIDFADPARQPVPKPDVRSMLRPLGPIVVFGASNFPLAFSVAGGDTASAFAAGNPVIVLAHYSHPGTAELVGMAIRDAVSELGLPEGVFSLLYDSGYEVAQALVAHPHIKGGGFTGSRSGGTALLKIANSRPEPIPFFAEMSSVNPVFVLPNALKSCSESLAKGLHGSVTLGVGQFCTNPGVVVTTGDDANFVSQLATLMSETRPGAMLNRRISSSYESAVSERMTHKSVTVRAAQKAVIEEAGKKCQASAALFETDAKSWLADETLHSEIFGPTTIIVHAGGKQDLLEIARKLEGNLTATIHGTEDDLRDNADLIAALETKVGRILFNGFPTGVEVCQAMVHGGPYPATSDSRTTSVGARAILRFARPVCFQDFPETALPDELKTANPLGILRLVGGRYIREMEQKQST